MGAIHFSLDEKLVRFFTEKLPVKTFVETGTFRGDTLAMARRYFLDCHSAELSQELHDAACKRFTDDASIHLHQGPSQDFLASVSAEMSAKPVFFWLDAHWCSADNTAGQDSQSPLVEELAAIGKLHPDSVVLIDDARLYLSTPPAPHAISDWPDIHDIAPGLFALGDSHRMSVFDDIIAFYPARLQKELARHIHENAVDWLDLVAAARKHQARRHKRGLRRFFPKKQD